jgi:hypothetical protein
VLQASTVDDGDEEGSRGRSFECLLLTRRGGMENRRESSLYRRSSV